MKSTINDLDNSVHPDWHLFSDHAPLMVSITINEENIDSFRLSITRDSKEEVSFIKEVMHAIKSINIIDIFDSIKLKEVTNFPHIKN